MKKILTVVLLISSLAFTNSSSTVFVCNNGSTKVYHVSENCKPLRNCTHEIKQMSISDAEKRGLRVCKVCG